MCYQLLGHSNLSDIAFVSSLWDTTNQSDLRLGNFVVVGGGTLSLFRLIPFSQQHFDSFDTFQFLKDKINSVFTLQSLFGSTSFSSSDDKELELRKRSIPTTSLLVFPEEEGRQILRLSSPPPSHHYLLELVVAVDSLGSNLSYLIVAVMYKNILLLLCSRIDSWCYIVE